MDFYSLTTRLDLPERYRRGNLDHCHTESAVRKRVSEASGSGSNCARFPFKPRNAGEFEMNPHHWNSCNTNSNKWRKKCN
jgi:hypothetical protein